MAKAKNQTKAEQARIARQQREQELKERLLKGPELFLPEKGSDDHLDSLSYKVKLLGGDEFILSDYVAEIMAEYESKFYKAWFYRLAELYNVSYSEMDRYIKPDFVRHFIIQFVYGRFPYLLFRTLRGKNRKTSTIGKRTKLFQHLSKDASKFLDLVIDQIYTMMGESSTPMEFKLNYSKKYKIYFQLEMELN